MLLLYYLLIAIAYWLAGGQRLSATHGRLARRLRRPSEATVRESRVESQQPARAQGLGALAHRSRYIGLVHLLIY